MIVILAEYRCQDFDSYLGTKITVGINVDNSAQSGFMNGHQAFDNIKLSVGILAFFSNTVLE